MDRCRTFSRARHGPHRGPLRVSCFQNRPTSEVLPEVTLLPKAPTEKKKITDANSSLPGSPYFNLTEPHCVWVCARVTESCHNCAFWEVFTHVRGEEAGAEVRVWKSLSGCRCTARRRQLHERKNVERRLENNRLCIHHPSPIAHGAAQIPAVPGVRPPAER